MSLAGSHVDCTLPTYMAVGKLHGVLREAHQEPRLLDQKLGVLSGRPFLPQACFFAFWNNSAYSEYWVSCSRDWPSSPVPLASASKPRDCKHVLATTLGLIATCSSFLPRPRHNDATKSQSNSLVCQLRLGWGLAHGGPDKEMNDQ